jgi:hypothetical protein
VPSCSPRNGAFWEGFVHDTCIELVVTEPVETSVGLLGTACKQSKKPSVSPKFAE